MGEMADLLKVDSLTAINFFFTNLKDHPKTRGGAQIHDETRYVASVLAHYTHVSCDSQSDMPTPRNLVEVFDITFMTKRPDMGDKTWEECAAQILLLAGFFRFQMNWRHNVRWYDEIGESFYQKIAQLSKKKERREFFGRMAPRFPTWTSICADTSVKLRRERYLI
jgi:hypothetical protein